MPSIRVDWLRAMSLLRCGGEARIGMYPAQGSLCAGIDLLELSVEFGSSIRNYHLGFLRTVAIP
jgi:hypothetical protein